MQWCPTVLLETDWSTFVREHLSANAFYKNIEI